MNPEAARGDAIVLLTGLLRALHSYADADPELADTILMDAGQIRRIRDGLVDGGSRSMEHYKADYGGNREWAYSFLRLVNRDELEWPQKPSRDPWERAGE
jgi:hypothetical protein